MQPSIEKLLKFFKLEADRGYDNRAIVGGLEKILPNWEAEARANNIPEEAIQMVRSRIGEYSASPEKRETSLKEVWAFIGSSTGMSEQEINSLTFTSRRKEPTPSSPEKSSSRPNQYSNNKSRPFPASGHSPQQPQVRLGLSAPLTVIQGIGPKYAETLARLGLNSLEDLLFYFPRQI